MSHGLDKTSWRSDSAKDLLILETTDSYCPVFRHLLLWDLLEHSEGSISRCRMGLVRRRIWDHGRGIETLWWWASKLWDTILQAHCLFCSLWGLFHWSGSSDLATDQNLSLSILRVFSFYTPLHHHAYFLNGPCVQHIILLVCICIFMPKHIDLSCA